MADARPSTAAHLRVYGALKQRLIAANVVAGALILVYFLLTSPTRGKQTRLAQSLVAVGSFVVLTGVMVPLAVVIARRRLVPLIAWLEDPNHQPTEEERDSLLRAPWVVSRFLAPFYVVASLITATSFWAGGQIAEGNRTAVGINLGALTALTLTFLLIEQTLRPYFPRAFVAGEQPNFDQRAAMGVRRRLLLAWTLGSAIPIVGIAWIPLARHGGSFLPIAVPIVAVSVIALFAGALITVQVANSLASPLRSIRRALERVQTGDLDTELPVDDAGEIGMLQAGFNDMVGGLRERQRLRHLFGRHVGEDVARAALEGHVGFAGEQRDVTVFFIDLIGSTALAETRPPTEVVALLNELFALVARAVDAEGGWINKFEGDAAMCVFGAPLRQEDHAARALRAACTLRESLVELRRTRPGLDAGIGVATGLVAAGNVGSEERYEYTVIGPPVNAAARLTEHAKSVPSRLLVDAATVDAAGPDVVRQCGLCRAGSVELRGIAAPAEVYAVAV